MTKDPDIVLVIDDEDAARLILSDMMCSAGLKVAGFADPISAIEYYRDNFKNIGMVFFDMTMPRLNGRETFFLLKKINRNIRSIVLSGSGMNDEIENILKEGCLKYIEKPVCYQTLEDVMAASLLKGFTVRKYQIERSLLVKIADIPGADFEKALIRSGGRTDLFFNIMSRFLESYEDSETRMRSMMEKDHSADLSAYAHLIKNNSATLGLYGLKQAAERIEKESLASNNCNLDTVIYSFETMKQDVFCRLDEFLKNYNADKVVDHERSKDISSDCLLKYLKELLECTGKKRPLKCFEIFETKLKNAVCREFTHEDRERISDLIRNYEFAELADHLNMVLEKFRSGKK